MENAIMVAAALVGAGLGDGMVTSRFIEGITRQPEAKNTLFTNTLISVGLIEAMAIIATVVALIMLSMLTRSSNNFFGEKQQKGGA